MKFYVMTDIHLYSKRNWLADPYKWERKATQLQLRESEEILREAFDYILKDPTTNTVLITGDLTDNGEITSHEDVLKVFEEYTNKGLKILVTTSTHDFREMKKTKYSKPDQDKCLSYGYDENYEYKRFIPCAKREDLRAWYAPYGRNDAVNVDYDSMSYSYDLDEKHRLLAINDDFIANNKNNQRGLNEVLLSWIIRECKRAKEDEKTLVTCLHHPVLTPSPIYQLIGARDIIAKNLELAKIFTDNGVNVVYTGHSHIHDIEFHKTEDGKPFYDISTGSLIGYPPVMRCVEYLDDGKIDVRSIVLQDLSRFDLEGKTLSEYCREGFFGMVENMVGAMREDMVTFAIYANSISIRPWTVYQFWWLFKTAGILLDKLTVGKIYKLCKKESKLSKEDILPIKDEKVVPIILRMVEKLYAGNADFTPDKPEFSVIMATVSIIDDIIKTLKINLKKLIGYSTLKEIVEPLAYNNGIDDYNAVINPFDAPIEKETLPQFKSNKGLGVILSLIAILLISLPIILPVGLVVGLIILLRGTKTFNPYRDYKKVLPPRVQNK